MIFGTPEYMSPEQAKGERVDHRVDVYAVGVIMYELLTGRVPFTADTFMGILTKHMFEAPAGPEHASRPGVSIPHEAEAVILKALQKDREYRLPEHGRDGAGDRGGGHRERGGQCGRRGRGRAALRADPLRGIFDGDPARRRARRVDGSAAVAARGCSSASVSRRPCSSAVGSSPLRRFDGDDPATGRDHHAAAARGHQGASPSPRRRSRLRRPRRPSP